MVKVSVVICAFLAACDVGSAVTTSGTDGGGSNTNNTAQCVNAVSPASAAHVHTNPSVATNPTNAGLDCLAAGCHSAGGGGGQFQFAGTIYTQTGGTTAAAGVTVRVSFGGSVVTAVSDDHGNFYTSQAVTYGSTTSADVTSCPTITPMVNKLTATSSGGCNSCHVSGADAPPLGLM